MVVCTRCGKDETVVKLCEYPNYGEVCMACNEFYIMREWFWLSVATLVATHTTKDLSDEINALVKGVFDDDADKED